MNYLEGGLENVPGYRFAALACNIRYADRLDYAIIMADGMCNAAGVFTTNRLCAAPVRLCRERMNEQVKAILINATNANACTGRKGYNNARFLTADIAERLKVRGNAILMSSTGIIGHQLPVDKMTEAHDRLISSATRESGALISRAIMTTDTFPKSKAVSFETSMGTFTLAGVAKGAGMIAPNMATMLSFMLTDAPIPKDRLQSIFELAVGETMNTITIDGDTSTNDTAIILSPVSDKPLTGEKDLQSFAEALFAVLADLSEMIVRDGEGATKLIRVHVTGARTREDAASIARHISESVLVKTAFFGQDPNWGRIAMAVGNAGAEVDEETLTIKFGHCAFFEKGTPLKVNMEEAKRVMAEKEITVTVDCGMGEKEALFLTSDLSYEYVKINAEYTT
jgi:glutamate N-acetyltransferase/amino-acid N-acetyltransferase